MQLKLITGVLCIVVLTEISCSKKHHPQKEIATISTATEIKKAATDSNTTANVKPAYKKIKAPPLPKVITLDDRGAKKAVDGRLYYDLEGKRYWRNYDDGKYYQYKENLFDDPAFKPH